MMELFRMISEEAMRRPAMILAAAVLAAALALTGCGPDVSAPQAPSQTPSQIPSQTPSRAPEAGEVSPEPAEAETGYKAGNVLPDFSVPLAGGGTFILSENLGMPVFINLFATWCPPCIGEMPDINRLYGEMGDQVKFLIIDVGEDEQTALSFADQNGYTVPFAYSEDGMPFGSDYLITTIPRTFVLDADGVISAYFEGSRDYDTFRAAIQAALAH